VLHNAEWSRNNFAIPANFNGDRLKTMEARYPSGLFAGPESWTPYKQFGASFDADYDNGMIKLTREFFAEVEDGEVLLAFHFWSGEKLEYHLLVEGGKVTGTVPGGDPGGEPGEETGQTEGDAGEGATPVVAPVPTDDPVQHAGDGADA